LLEITLTDPGQPWKRRKFYLKFLIALSEFRRGGKIQDTDVNVWKVLTMKHQGSKRGMQLHGAVFRKNDHLQAHGSNAVGLVARGDQLTLATSEKLA
jgi:hypothetical protein